MSYFNYFRAHDQFIPRHFGFRGGGGFFPHRGGHVSVTENINIQNGPSGFWGFMTGLTQGLFGGGMGCGMGMGMGSIFGCPSMPMMGMPMMGMSPYAMLNGAVTPQGAQQSQSAEPQNNLTQLRNLFKAKNVTIEETQPGKFTATDSKGNVIGTNLSFEEMSDKLSKLNSTNSSPEAEKPEEAEESEEQKLAKLQEEKAKEKGLTKDKDEEHHDDGDTSVKHNPNTATHGPRHSGSPKGWYRASNDKSSKVNTTHNSDGSGKSAQQITSAVLSTKLSGALNKAQQTELCNMIIKNNPSVFDSSGKPKANADYTKLDVPTMEWIENHFGLKHGSKVARHDDIHSNPAGTRTIQGKNGYYVKIDGKGNKTYYDPNGKKISGEEFQKHCPTIYKNVNNK